MRKSTFGVLTMLAAIAALSVTPGVARAQEIPDEMTLDGCGETRAAVSFPHKAHHEAIECTTCHHNHEDLTLEAAQGGMKVETCTSCHLEPEEADTPACTERSLRKNPFHVNCVGCHKESMEKDASLSLPAKCAECHPKPEEEEAE